MAKRGGLGAAAITLIILDAVLVAALVVIMVTWPDTTTATSGAAPAATRTTAGQHGGSAQEATTPPAVEVPDDAEQVDAFVMPSGNIWCELNQDEAHCTIAEFSFSPPPVPDCDKDLAGHVWQVTAEGADPVCAPDGQFDQPEGLTELAYGKAAVAGDFLCLSDRQGVTCKSIPTGHGFEIARDGTRSF